MIGDKNNPTNSCERCGHQAVMHRPKGVGHKLICQAYSCRMPKRCEFMKGGMVHRLMSKTGEVEITKAQFKPGKTIGAKSGNINPRKTPR